MEATLNLFKALPVQDKKKDPERLECHSLLKVTVPRGFIFAPEVIANYSEQELLEIAKDIGRTPGQLNSSFHKSWKKVAEADIELLVLEQILHYITTYGFQELGIYNADTVYIPKEQLDIPGIKDDMALVVIKGYTKEELKKKVLKMLSSGVALKEDTFNDLVKVCMYVDISVEDLSTVKNKEARIKLYDFLDILPEDPIEFLRFLLYRTIHETLLVKSKDVTSKIASAEKMPALTLFMKYEKRYGLKNLSEIFNRFKPLFLAFKSERPMNVIINKISRLSKKYHKAMGVDFLNGITSMIKHDQFVSIGTLMRKLDVANTFRKIRLAYALKYRTKDVSSILYRIRNGKSWATKAHYDGAMRRRSAAILDVVIESIVGDINKRVGGKKIYLPPNIEYALPATEKQFTGNFPSGTCVTVDQDMVFGIHWFNHKKKKGVYAEEASVDLDLSFILSNGNKYGWDGEYRSGERDYGGSSRTILFSGDKTDAPRPDGASELFYLAKALECPGILTVNYYNFSPEEVPFEIVVGKRSVGTFNSNYTIDPNDIVCSVESKMDCKQKMLGIVKPVPEGIRFYFSETGMGNSITAKMTSGLSDAGKYLLDFYTDMLSLNSILALSDVEVVENAEDCDIDLSPEKIERDTILNLLS